jgi:hypothetical protein
VSLPLVSTGPGLACSGGKCAPPSSAPSGTGHLSLPTTPSQASADVTVTVTKGSMETCPALSPGCPLVVTLSPATSLTCPPAPPRDGGVWGRGRCVLLHVHVKKKVPEGQCGGRHGQRGKGLELHENHRKWSKCANVPVVTLLPPEDRRPDPKHSPVSPPQGGDSGGRERGRGGLCPPVARCRPGAEGPLSLSTRLCLPQKE